MDANTLMSLIGLFGGQNSAMPARVAAPGMTQMKLDGLGTGMGTAPDIGAPIRGTGIAPQPWNINSNTIPADREAADFPNLAQLESQGQRGVFSTGNILSALLGSNFGQK